MSAAEIFAWLDSDEGLEWSRSRPERLFYESPVLDETAQGPGDVAEDPTGRGPIAGKGAPREKEVA